MKWNFWAENRVAQSHTNVCKCDGCSGARKAREAKGVSPKSNRWYSKYSGK